jgi:hypothetical protein
MGTRGARGLGRRAIASAGTLALGAAALVAVAVPASADDTSVDGVTLAWSVNNEVGGGAYFGGCNFLSAGEAGNAGSSRLWSEADGFYRTQAGNVTIEKPDASGSYAQPTWATKCQNPNGTAVSAANTNASNFSQNRVVFAGGTGQVDLAAGTASIRWDGAVTIVFYGGLTYWTASDPVLTVGPGGTGTLTATASGYGADMEDTSRWVPLTPQPITLANLTGVALTDDGFTVTPSYLGVGIATGTGTSQPAQTSGNAAYWGSFPQDFVDFQVLTGQSSYWYTSGGSRDAAKPANPLTVGWQVDSGTPTTPPDSSGVPVTVDVPEVVTPPGPGEFTWSVTPGGASLGTAAAGEVGFTASGTLPVVTVTDTRTAEGATWSVSGRVGGFAVPGGTATFGGQSLGWTPKVLAGDALAGTTVDPGVAAGTGLAAASTLASGAAGGETAQPVAVSADLSLLAPSTTPQGSYTATLTLTAVS